MVNCPNGHTNPAGWELCGECGAPIDTVEPEMSTWYQTKWAIAGGAWPPFSRSRAVPSRFSSPRSRVRRRRHPLPAGDPGMVVGCASPELRRPCQQERHPC